MTLRRTSVIASMIAMAFTLSACGGDSSGVASAPPPPGVTSPPPPPPPPPLTPAAATIAAPALAGMPSTAAFPVASDGGPTMMAHPTATFPVLQSVVSIGSAGVVADTATISAGTSLTFDSSDSSYAIDIGNPALGVSNVVLNSTPSGGFSADVTGGRHVSLEIADPATSDLSWTSFGYWDVALTDGTRTQAQFVTGYATPAGALPTTGTATYKGAVRGEVILPQAGRDNGVNYLALSGDAYLDANFASGTISGALREMFATDFDGNKVPWNWVSLAGTFSGQNMFSGTTSVAETFGNSSLKSTATGTFAGAFFGPQGQELGAVWTLSDGTGAAFGTIGAKDCNGCTPWDY